MSAPLDKQLDKAAAATSESELIEILQECDTTSIYMFHKGLLDAVIKALSMDNIETAKKLAIVYAKTDTGDHYYNNKFNFQSILIVNKSLNLTWVSFIELLVRRTGRYDEYDFLRVGKALASHGLIRLVDFVKRPICVFTKMLICFPDADQIPETIYKIMTDKALTRSDRLNMLTIMKRFNKLTLQPCGPDKLAPHFYCLSLRRLYLLKFFTDIPGIAQLRGPNGENFLAYASTKHPYLKHVRLFSKDELKSMIIEKLSNLYVLDLLASFTGTYVASEFLTAVKELLMEGHLKDSREVDAPKLTNPKFIYSYSGIIGSNDSYKVALKNCYGAFVKKLECDGKTTFAFEELPLEIFQPICEELDSRALIALLLTSKSLQEFSERFGLRYYERMMRKEFPMVHELKSTVQNVDWKHELGVHSRLSYGWRTCKDPKQIQIGKNYYPTLQEIISFDENWLICRMIYNQETLLWNVHDQKVYNKKHKSFPAHRLAVLHSPEVDFPTVVSLSTSHTRVINYNTPEVIVDEFAKAWDSRYVTPVSRSRFISGGVPELFDVELHQTVAQNTNISNVYQAAYNKFTQMTAMCSVMGSNSQYKTIAYVLDKNFEITHSTIQNKYSYCSAITWLDEFTYALKDYSSFRSADIRMPRDYVHETNKLSTHKPITISEDKGIPPFAGNFTSNHVLKIDNSNIKLGYVWSVKDFTWSNVVVLPDDVKGDPMCNSRYVAFTTKGNSLCLLDFAASK